MAGMPRQSAFMPTIKCSQCGNQVEISMMGNHICGGAGNVPEPPPPMPDLLGGAFSSLKQNVFDKFTRPVPAVDTAVANRAFSRSGQLTPVSASTGSQTISPKTPTNGRSAAGYSGDGFFSPEIADSPRRTGGYGGFTTESESFDDGVGSPYGTSPQKQASNLLSRMNSIAPGPFEADRRPGAKNAFPRSGSREYAAEPLNDSLSTGHPSERPGTGASGLSANNGYAAPPRVPRKNGYGGFGPPLRDNDDLEPKPLGMGKRSETFPDKIPTKTNNDSMYGERPLRMPSAPGPRPDRLRNSSNTTQDSTTMSDRSRRPSFGLRDTSRPPPPRKSLMRPQTRNGSGGLSINLADEFGVGNPYHSPSESQSSNQSGFSQGSQPSEPSATTSPARSVPSRNTHRRKPSDTSGFDALMDDLQNSMDAMQSNNLPKTPVIPLPLEKDDMLRSNTRREPPQNLKLDPAIQNGRNMRLDLPMKSPTTLGQSEGRNNPGTQGGRTRSPIRQTHKREPSRDPRSRGNCKACGDPITGKSISSADGRLTGRYHKACFVCTTCREPFSSATFYVLDDKPYCEHHYHKLNGSLCGTCNKGIEGQYLEDEASVKYHPNCFKCGDCGTVLRDGYFDVNGRAYCERDAWKRVQSATQAQVQARRSPPSPTIQEPPRRPSAREIPRGLPANPASKFGPLNRPFGLPSGTKLVPGQALGRNALSPVPRMEKRMTRLGMM